MKIKNKNKERRGLFFLPLLALLLFSGFFVANGKIAKADATCACYENILSVGVDTTAASKEECRFICVNREAKNYRFDGVAGVAKCPATFIPNADFTKCECPTGKQVIAGTTYCGDPALAAENSVIVGTPNDPAWSEPRASIYGDTTATPQTKKFEYKLLEAFPGFFQAGQVMTDLPKMVVAIYKFGIWTVGIAGMFMLVVGGFMYMASAGNTSSASSARGIITDALVGIVAALGAYLFLYVINPDLTKISLKFTPVDITKTQGTPMGPAGVCQPATSGDCTVSNLTSVFGAKATEASSICVGESNGKSIPSNVDICADGSPASWGLFQINITANAIGSYDCPAAFSGGMYTSKNHNCRVKTDADSQALYLNCINAAKSAPSNIAAAKNIYSRAGNSWLQWGANKRSNCNFN